MKLNQIQLAVLALCGATMLSACGSSGSNTPTTALTNNRLVVAQGNVKPANKPSTSAGNQNAGGGVTTPAKPSTPPVETTKPTTPPVETTKPTTPPVETAKPTTPPVETAKPTTPPVETAKPTPPAEVRDGNAFQVPLNATKLSDIKTLNSTDSLKTLMIDGQTFNLPKLDNSALTFDKIDGAITSGHYLENMRFGITNGEKPTAFVQGNLTPLDQMPKTSSMAYYVGRAIVDKDSSYRSFVSAAFDLKLINGTINSIDESNKEYKFAGTIKGNTFEIDEQKGKGAFFGPNAVEMGGVYLTPEGKTAVFGGNRTIQLTPREKDEK